MIICLSLQDAFQQGENFDMTKIDLKSLSIERLGFLLSSLKYPGDFRSWESPQTLPALFTGSFEHVERFRNLKFAVITITDIQSTDLSSSEGITAIHLAFK